MAMAGSGPVAGIIAGTLLSIGGWFCAFSIGKPIRERAAASVGWPVAEGRITRSELSQARDKGTTMYWAEVAYEYAVDGRKHSGDTIWIGDGYRSSDATHFRRVVSRYPVGHVVDVHYDPAEPESSVLEPGATWSSGMLYFTGLGVLALGSVILLSAVLPLAALLVALLGSQSLRSSDPSGDFDAPHRPSASASRADSFRGTERRQTGADDGIMIG